VSLVNTVAATQGRLTAVCRTA